MSGDIVKMKAADHTKIETQTPYWFGMRIYQWIAIVFVIAGSVFTCIPSVSLPEFQLSSGTFLWAFLIRLISIVAYGVDFPNSNRRFERLTSN